jgi:hypothetical protein
MIGYSEHAFQQVWSNSALRLTGLHSDMGQTIDIIDNGQWNHLGGPDFLDAHILIDGTLFRGGIELHLKPSEWYAHGHHLDTAYNCVVLHASPMPAKRSIVRSDGTRIPHVNIERILPSWLPLATSRNSALPCISTILSNMDALNAQLQIAGARYFEELAERHISLIRDPNNPSAEILRSIFIRSCSVLGAPANRDSMTEAAIALWDRRLCASGNESISLFQTAGWRLNSGRPYSRPHIRMTQAYALLDNILQLNPSLLLGTSAKELMWQIIPPTVGAQTTNVIFKTVLLPALWVYATLKGEVNISAQVRLQWDESTLPPSPSASMAFGAIVKSIDKKNHKGLTWQQRNLCLKRECSSCRVGIRMMN